MNQDFGKMMRDAQNSLAKMQQDMAKMQTELAAIMVEGTAGGGAVTIICNGNSEFKQVKIKKEAVDPNDVETLEDLVLAAVKDASAKAQALMQQRAGALTAGLNLPPGMGF
ncbi:MAG: YbaB/EbfC family nucleoid-associated protein [Candidatus Obscuribacterales bacterium]|nr:YbaB/EbfC family nucleoid-associated protein [Candidatus Obscuribacterales bacterium]